jgi:hypothetical protein
MAFTRKAIDPELQSRLQEMAAEMRRALYGEAAFPEWGTRFREIEQDGMSVGLELARLVIEQSVAEQARHMPASAMEVAGDEVRPAGTNAMPLGTEAGAVSWDEPRAELKRGRKAFFPPAASARSEGR